MMHLPFVTQSWYFAASQEETEEIPAHPQRLALNEDKFYETMFMPTLATSGIANMKYLEGSESKLSSIPKIPLSLGDDESSMGQDTKRKIKIKKIKLPTLKNNKDLNKILKKL